MMLAGPTLRVVPVTTHIPLRDVPGALTIERIVAKGRAAIRGLQRQFGIERPRVAVAGLNPHAGESGALGREEIDIIVPAIERLREEGYRGQRPAPARHRCSTRAARRNYDVALCMYHDQALIPLKTLHFDEGINITLGLPIVRTSPDHGTAFDIAGKELADPGAMIAAIRTAGDCARRLADGVTLEPAAAAARGDRAARAQRVARRSARISCSTSNCSTGSPACPGRSSGERVYEVGPGPGGLTRALLRAGAEVVAVERDRRCLAPLWPSLRRPPTGRLRVIEGDALAIDEPRERAGAHIVANLPYNVGTALLVRWLGGEAWPPWWRSLTLMFQQEVAERIVAAPGSGAYGRLAVLAQWRARRGWR